MIKKYSDIYSNMDRLDFEFTLKVRKEFDKRGIQYGYLGIVSVSLGEYSINIVQGEFGEREVYFSLELLPDNSYREVKVRESTGNYDLSIINDYLSIIHSVYIKEENINE